MKKIILILIVFINTTCQTSQEKLVNQTDSYIQKEFIPNLDNPKSYEAVKTVVIDTFTNKDSIFTELYGNYLKSSRHKFLQTQHLVVFDSLMRLNKDFDKNYNIMIEKEIVLENRDFDSLKNISLKTPVTSIYTINLRHIFRVQNKFGAVVLDTVTIKYDYRNKIFKIY